MSNYKTVNGLMRHLRNQSIAINGSQQKRKLINTGYFHGYKGYRFFKDISNKLPFTAYDQIYETIKYDTKLKALLYEQIMFVETALKNISLQLIIEEIQSSSLNDMFSKAISSYRLYYPPTLNEDARQKLQTNKLNLTSRIQNLIVQEYRSGNPIITHYYNGVQYQEMPLWAIFEILTLGQFGFLLSCLTYDLRDKISDTIGLRTSYDTNRKLLQQYIYCLKDLRNAIAHNNVVYDTRFRAFDSSPQMRQCLKQEIGLPFVNFKWMEDYIFLICYLLKQFSVSKTDIRAFIRDFEDITNKYKKSVNNSITSITIHNKQQDRLNILKKYI